MIHCQRSQNYSHLFLKSATPSCKTFDWISSFLLNRFERGAQHACVGQQGSVDDRRYWRHDAAEARRLVSHRLRAAVRGFHPVRFMVRGVRPVGGARLSGVVTLVSAKSGQPSFRTRPGRCFNWTCVHCGRFAQATPIILLRELSLSTRASAASVHVSCLPPPSTCTVVQHRVRRSASRQQQPVAAIDLHGAECGGRVCGGAS